MKVKRHPESPGAAHAQSEAERARLPRGRRFARLVRNLSLATFGFSTLAAVALWGVSERTWWGTVFTFCPRHPFLVPPAVLLLASVVVHRWSIVMNLACLVLVAGPLMGTRLPFKLLSSGGVDGRGLSVVSCNVQEYRPDFEAVLQEIVERHPDVVAFQEAPYEHDLYRRYFQGWNTIQEPNLWIGSRFPIRRLDVDHSPLHDRVRVLSVRIDTQDGPFILHDVHLTTPRHGLAKLSIESVLNGQGPAFLEDSTRRRMVETREVRRYIARSQSSFPTLIVGDFNMPTVSNLYRDVWQDFTNAFDEVGIGSGYTALCSTQSYWFNDVPWVRIDHVLADRAWAVRACEIGHGRGSDHRLIWALLTRR
jgi:endonuclease/exonuclease/phosphatase (EEP) superfamily protein YafD